VVKPPLTPLACLCGREKIAKEGKEMEIFAKEEERKSRNDPLNDAKNHN